MEGESEDDCYSVTVESSVCDEQGASLVKQFQVNLLSHCIFCLRKISPQRTCSLSSVDLQHAKLSEHLQIVPRAELSTCSSTFLSTFNHTWSYLCRTKERDDGSSRDLLKILMSSHQTSTTFLELPQMCQLCADALTMVDRLLRDVQNQLNVIRKIIQKSKNHGMHSWRAEQFHRALSCSNLESEVINATEKIIDGVCTTAATTSNFLDSTNQDISILDSIISPEQQKLEVVPPSLKSRDESSIGNVDLHLELDSPPEGIDDAADGLDFFDENDESNDMFSDSDYIKSEPEDEDNTSSSDDMEWTPSKPSRTTLKSQEKTQSCVKTKTTEMNSSENSKVKLDSSTSHKKRRGGAGAATRQTGRSQFLKEMEEKGKLSLSVNPGTGKEIYICRINCCDTTLSSFLMLRRHQIMQHSYNPEISASGSGIYKCGHCDKLYFTQHRLQEHIRNVHKDVQCVPKRGSLQTCDLCKMKLPKKELYEHIRTHVGEEYLLKCPNAQCLYAYTNPRSLYKHFGRGNCRKSLPGTYKEFIASTNVCQVCGNQATNRKALRGHLLRLHETPTKNFSCPIAGCLQQFTARQSVSCHIADHDISSQCEVQMCGICNVEIKVEQMKQHLEDAHGTQDVVRCNQCPLVFPTRELLLVHLHAHRHGILSCDICGDEVKYSRYIKLREHYYKVHSIGKGFTCDKCGHVSWSKFVADRHKLFHHEDKFTLIEKIAGDKKKLNVIHKCDLCGAEFKTDYTLRAHNIKEHGAEPFSCTLCNEVFVYRKKLQEHEKEHKGIIKKEFKCNEEGCGKTYSKNVKLQDHISSVHRGEKPHVCELCGKSFSHDCSLKTHQNNIHLGVRSHICDTCGESFTAVSSLRRHKLIHTGERPFPCDICGQRFRFNEVLRRHLEGHQRKGADFKPNGPMKHVRKRVERKSRPAS